MSHRLPVVPVRQYTMSLIIIVVKMMWVIQIDIMPVVFVLSMQHKLNSLIELYDRTDQLLALNYLRTYDTMLSFISWLSSSWICYQSQEQQIRWIKRYQFVAMNCDAKPKKYIFRDECYLSLRNAQQIVWCKRGEPTSKKKISYLRAHINIIGFIWLNVYVFRRFDSWFNFDQNFPITVASSSSVYCYSCVFSLCFSVIT